MNAVTDALQPFGVDHIDMPLSNEAVWGAVNDSAVADGGRETDADETDADETGGAN